jgi:hypothetical protein
MKGGYVRLSKGWQGREQLLYKRVAFSGDVVQCVDASHGFSFFKQQSKSPPALLVRSKENCGVCGIHKKVLAVIGLWKRSETHHSW